MKAFELPKAERPDASPCDGKQTPDAASLMAEIESAKQAAEKRGHADGYAQGHQQGHQTGLTEGHAEGLNKGLDEGHAKGYSEGYEEGSVQARREAERLAELVAATQSALSRIHDDMGQAVLALAVKIAGHVLQSTLEDDPARLLDVVKQLLHLDPDGKNPLTLFLNPGDCELVSGYLRDNENTQAWRIIEDVSITAGGCRARTALGDIDATLETRWRRAVTTLNLKGQLPTPGHLAGPQAESGS